jgi:hypothetical protein
MNAGRETQQAENNKAVDGHSVAGLLLLVLVAVLLTRFSWAPSHQWLDNVNLAYALESFDPAQHQPQPPGYPLFVAVSRLIQLFSPTVELTFWVISVAVTAASVSLLYLLAHRIFSRWVALASVLLFLVSPVQWFTRLQSPLRPWLALFSLLVAYCAWRCWNGEARFVQIGAVALAIAGGFRPDLLAYLFPLWAAAAWRSTRSWKELGKGCLAIAGVSSLWIGAVVHAMGGIGSTAEIIRSYLLEQSRLESVGFSESIRNWARPASRLIIWNAMGVLGWIWAPVLAFRRAAVLSAPWRFLLIWLVPGMIFQLVVHIATPGHTLFATPILCLIGAHMISVYVRQRDGVLAIALMVNASLFLNAVPRGYPALPDASVLESVWISARNSIAYGTFETSMERLRWREEMHEVSLQELSTFRAPSRPNVIIALNGNDTEFDFINWRVISYYLPEEPIWVLIDNLPAGVYGRIRLVRGRTVEVRGETSITLPRSSRILWVTQLNGRIQRRLEEIMPVHRGRYILYSDIPPNIPPFEIEGFRFIPE